MSLLDKIQSPSDLRDMSAEQLSELSQELRDFLVHSVSKTGGHLASSLGVVELTIALHYCFKTPTDKIVWDVGHQAYAHKILTGRKERFNTLRQYGGISGFPRISESEYDHFSVGHASTSISAALGLAIGRDLRKEDHSVVAVIGDGSLSGGLALEGLNNLGSSSTRMTVILNDNEMSIAKNVGALSRYLTRVITDKRYNKLKTEIWELLGNLSNVGKGLRSIVRTVDDAIKHVIIPGKLFEDMGLRYIGPVDGHNISEMKEIFDFVRNETNGPVLIHTITKKGKGYSYAEENSTKYHGISKFSPNTGNVIKKPAPPSYSEIFGNSMVELGHQCENLVAITAAMPDGTGLNSFKSTFPERFFDVGIAEEHAVTFAAGLALKGLKPVVAIYSTFMQRAYDQVMQDVALDKTNVIFCLDRAGLVGDDGPTHHGMFDISYLRTVPGAVIMAPKDEKEMRDMMYTAVKYEDGPVFIRYPRGCGTGAPTDLPFTQLNIGTPEILARGENCALVSIGDSYSDAKSVHDKLAEEGIETTLVDARFAKPLSKEFYREIFSNHPHIVTFENNALPGGFGSALMELAEEMELESPPKIMRIGLPDLFVGHGDVAMLKKEHGLDTDSMMKKISRFLRIKPQCIAEKTELSSS
ncbi:1-deoxy-D-xylulose 5-phosphate synthase [Chitinispirillum alkaliphilum]|nr:1-deoxy-D-xylulose 5-phosphate synthase [Chitinispirillum alkaliphilum]